MTPQEVKDLGLTFTPAQAIVFAVAEDLEREGEVTCGRIVAYDPDKGALNYERTANVGCLVLQEPGNRHWTKIALDKLRLADAVWLAMVELREALTYVTPFVEKWIVIRYLGNDKGYKDYKVTTAYRLQEKV